MNNFTREEGEIRTYQDLSILVQTEPDVDVVTREIAMARNLDLITEEQVSVLAGLFEVISKKE
jgi:hypothetical protein